MIPPIKDIERCKDYLNRLLEYRALIEQLQNDKVFNSNESSLSDGMPRGSGISKTTELKALNNIETDRQIKEIQKKANRMIKNIVKVLDKFPEEELTMRLIIEGVYIKNEPKSVVARQIGATKDSWGVLFTQAIKTYTYYFYRSRQRIKRV